MAWKDLTMAQKAELMKIFAGEGVANLKEIRELYDTTLAEHSPVLLSSGGKIHINPENRGKFNATKARTGKTTEELTHSKNPLTRKRAIFAQNAAKWNKKEDGGHLDAPVNMLETGGLKGIFGKVFGKREEPATPQKPLISDEQLRSLVDDLTASLDDEYTHYLDKYDYGWHTYKLGERESNYDGDRYYDVVKARYDGLSKAMDSMNFSSEEKERLMPFLLTQNVLEGGWRVNKAATERGGLNNFGGMRVAGTKKFQNFENPDDFYVAYLKNLDEKWGDAYLGKGKGWRHAKDLADYARIINMEDLGLETKEQWREYSRKHPEKPAYIYTPLWENSGTELMSPQKFGGIYPRVYAYYEFMRQRQKNLEDLLKLNNVYNDPRLVEWGVVRR